MNFDLNLANYKKPELEEIFDLSPGYNESILQIKADLLQSKIESDRRVDSLVRKKTLDFLLQAKNFLMEGLKKILNDTKLENRLENNIYNTDLNLRGSAIIAENGSQYIIDRAANSTPYNLSFPGDTFPGVINPLKKRTIIKNLNIDTRFRNNYYTTPATNFQFDLPYKFSSVTTMQLTSFEFIQSYYVIDHCLGNNFFSLQLLDSLGNPKDEIEFIFVPDGNYTRSSLMTVLNNLVSTLTSDLKHVFFSLNNGVAPDVNNKVTIGINPAYAGPSFNFSVNFALDKNGNLDSATLQQKFGWILGFRNPVYPVPLIGGANSYEASPYVEPGPFISSLLNSYTSESVLDLSGPKYIYLVVDDYNNNVNENFFSAFTMSILNKNILARIAVGPNVGAPFVTIDAVFNGSFLTPRTYFGPVDIQKMKIQLLDEYGRILNLNGTDYSFVVALTTAYDI